MRFEEVLPALRELKYIKRTCTDGKISLVKCKDNKVRMRVWRGCQINYPYNLNADDLLANDWEVYDNTRSDT